MVPRPERTFKTFLGALLVAVPLVGGAQQRSDYYWASGGISYSRFEVEMGDAEQSGRNGMTILMGLRICVLCAVRVKRLTLTPGLAYGITDVRGLDVEREPYAFSRLDFGAQLAYTIPATRLRPYVSIWTKPQRTSELPGPQGSVQNYQDKGGVRAYSYGLEIPLTPEGRGLDISVTPIKGVFTEREPLAIPPGGEIPYRGHIISIGWSGPFTGAGLPWR
jgi:hypothetical protein